MPSALVTMNAYGPAIERSTWVSAAKLTIASAPTAIASATASGSSIAPCTNADLGRHLAQVLPPAGVGQLVEHRHLVAVLAHPQRTNVEPMKPAAPQTSSFTTHPPLAAPELRKPSRQCGSTARRARSAARCRPGAARARELLGGRPHLAAEPDAATIACANSNHEHCSAGGHVQHADRRVAPRQLHQRRRQVAGEGRAADLVGDDPQLVALGGEPQDRLRKAAAAGAEQPRGAHDRMRPPAACAATARSPASLERP